MQGTTEREREPKKERTISISLVYFRCSVELVGTQFFCRFEKFVVVVTEEVEKIYRRETELRKKYYEWKSP